MIPDDTAESSKAPEPINALKFDCVRYFSVQRLEKFLLDGDCEDRAEGILHRRNSARTREDELLLFIPDGESLGNRAEAKVCLPKEWADWLIARDEKRYSESGNVG